MRAWAGIVSAVLGGGRTGRHDRTVAEGEAARARDAGQRVQVYFDRADRVVGIEVMGPTSDGQREGLEPEFTVRYAGVDVFRTPAKRLVDVVSRRARAKPVVTEAGSTLTFPALGIALWRIVVEDTPYFETVVGDPPKRPRS